MHNAKEVFDKYETVSSLRRADIFHLYDTGRECAEDNSGYHDSRHFELWAFNSETMQKCSLGVHDGIESFSDLSIRLIRVYSDGSFMIRLNRAAELMVLQCVLLK